MLAHSQSLLGEFPYDTMREVECVVGPVYFWSYICISFLLLLNVLLSIIVDTWTQVRLTTFTVPNSLHHASTVVSAPPPWPGEQRGSGL